MQLVEVKNNLEDKSQTMSPGYIVSLTLVSPLLASININTLPPDLRRLDFLDHIPPRSTINPVWSGDYSAALDGEQNKVLVSWTVLGQEEGIEFQVCVLCTLVTISNNST